MRFIFLAYDHTDPGALERRLAVRQEHLKEAVPDKRNGFILEGGAILDNHTSKNMIGSSMLIEAESEQAVWDRLRRDIYCTGNVWNMEKATLIPVINGFKDVK
ncbi:hypothetical protein NQZ79_g5971 [Umbelopsis isabellina]|nr:hypothetical protein NQZ79_g5971 [Umbelopsis isabellina]